MVTTDDIKKTLKHVKDPLMNLDVISLNMVKNITVQDSGVSIHLEPSIANYPHENDVRSQIENALKDFKSVKKVSVTFTSKVAKPVPEKAAVPGVKNIIAVYACKGGVGKSTVSTNLAVALAKQGKRVGLLDADIHGPNIPLMMGIQDNPKGAPGNKLIPLESHGVQLMSIGFLTNQKLPSIWRGPMIHGAILQLLRDTLWKNVDYLIVDLPPGTGDAQLSIIQSAPLAGVVFVTTPQTVSLVDGIKGIGMFRKLGVQVLGMIENMAGFTCPHCQKETNIFSKGGGQKEAQENNIPFLGAIPIDPAVVMGGDSGTPIVLGQPKSATAQAFLKVAQELAQKTDLH